MRLARLTPTGFDLVDLPDTNTSLVRTKDMVRLSYIQNGTLIQLVKNESASLKIGSSLTSSHSCLVGSSNTPIAKLLATPDQALRIKTVTIDGVERTASLLPVQIL